MDWVHDGPGSGVDKRRGGTSSARGRSGSPVVGGEDEVELVRGSPEHE
jgi:hypothetical protein